MAATLYHTSAFHEFVRAHCCVRFALHVCVLTVILCDRMITPFSPQLRGTSQLRSLSSTDPREGMCIHMYVNACFLWAAPLLCISVSSPPFPRPPTSSQEPSRHLTTKSTATGDEENIWSPRHGDIKPLRPSGQLETAAGGCRPGCCTSARNEVVFWFRFSGSSFISW